MLRRVQARQAIASSVIGTKKGTESVVTAAIAKGGANVAGPRNAAMEVTTGAMMTTVTTALAEGHRPDGSRREVGAQTVTRGAGEKHRGGPIRPTRGRGRRSFKTLKRWG